jgi:hypothetical protein
MNDETIRTMLRRLSRPHPSGGEVIERAAILAEGADSSAVLRWIADHDGQPEDRAPVASGRGLHSARLHNAGRPNTRPPLRYVLPPEALS